MRGDASKEACERDPADGEPVGAGARVRSRKAMMVMAVQAEEARRTTQRRRQLLRLVETRRQPTPQRPSQACTVLMPNQIR